MKLKVTKILINGNFYIPLIILLILYSCKNDSDITIDENVSQSSRSDSINKKDIIIQVGFKEKGAAGFNVLDKNNKNYYLPVINPSNNDTVISTILPRHFNNQVIRYLNGRYDKTKQQLISFPHYYLIMQENDTIRFNYFDGDIELVDNSIVNLDSLDIEDLIDPSSYIEKNPLSVLLKNISELHTENNQNTKEVRLINDVKMQLLLLELADYDRQHHLIKNYLMNLDDQNVDSYFASELMRSYISQRIDNNTFKDIQIKYLTSKSKQLVLSSVYFLLQDKYQHYRKNENLKNWFYQTDRFKSDSVFFKRSIEPYDAKQFKSLVKLLSLERSEIGKDFRTDNSSEFYLLDFWATWCAPCIQGIKSMKEMDIPDNVQIVNISIDKVKDIEKWRKMERDLGLNMSYWLSDTIEENKEFLKFVEMKSIPRYILMDKDLNLIDQAFYHHNEPEFLSKLNDVKNHESW